ncbi:TadE/TadG family type IV pilus assembly protein [Celeribacter sp. PS-C1]|uniref:TadE/TadG family type IV pilus assembly protein n=1 Tax=Celeribacter sp. PS-C1 TaxID=2820813 RepID=UPI001C9334E2|nr:TadE/TadG family type IV pilus assembly protein [Celeribacter sp. PS-C1]MBW6416732.1 pilus assembly protein [Celeribacter sp. PS-C1]
MLGKIESREAGLHLLKLKSEGKLVSDHACGLRADELRPGRRSALAALWRLRGNFARDEEGSFAIFGLFSFVIILLLAGIGIDIVRHEALRTELQNTLDRAVLAATNLENTNAPKDVIIDYFAKAGLSQYLNKDDIKIVPLGDGRQVSATVEATLPTYFMKFAAIDKLETSSYSMAEQGLSGLEVSMVLDVSGSMNSYSRLTNLKSAARDFTDTVFANAGADDVSFSVVPYATQVNAGAGILSKLNVRNAHNNSHCINFVADDFSMLGLQYADAEGTTRYYDQTMDFDAFNNNWSDLDMALQDETCAPASSREILPFSNNQTRIKNYISALSAYGNTSIDLGMKWGVALLDTSARSVSGSGHPADASDAQKFVVVMTDGAHTSQYYMRDPYRDDDEDTGVYKDKNGYIYVSADRRSCNYYNCWTTTYYTNIQNRNVSSNLPYSLNSNDIREMTWAEVWSSMTVYNHAYARYLAANNSNVYYSWRDATRTSYNASTKNNRLLDICSAAKEAGIIVFAIGFEAPSSGQDVMRRCASSDAHYYDVEGMEIAEAFSAIATKITELRLVK